MEFVTRQLLRFGPASAFHYHSCVREEFRAALQTQWNLGLALNEVALVRSIERASATAHHLQYLSSHNCRDTSHSKCSDRPAKCRGRSRTPFHPDSPIRSRTRAMHIRRSHAPRDQLLNDALLRLVNKSHPRDRNTLSNPVGRGRVKRIGWSASR